MGGSAGAGGGSAGGGRSAGGAPAAGATGGARRGGAAIDFRRGRTAKERLQIEWTYPVWKPKTPTTAPTAGGTVVAEVERALPLAEAYAWITDGDTRPLLILRECERCKGTDHALLSRSLDNEQTTLLTHWFRCVKLPPNVLSDKHPFYALFERAKEGDKVPHLFFADFDGANKTPLPGDQSQTQLWEVMFDYLDRAYVGDAKKVVKELRSILSQYDKIDNMEQDIKARMDKEIDKKGPDSDKLARFEQQLAKLAEERQELLGREEKLRALARAELATPKADGAGGN
ncbi:MAG: hypothetical protein IPK26_19875 [Planctomycetes bacterium]|nr:hypothetical protein [Planctomycetota bacterium]